MNLVLLYPGDFTSEARARLTGRRGEHIRTVHRAEAGKTLRVGVIGGRMGRATVASVSAECVDLAVVLTDDPPPPLPVTLLLALPRPKAFRRVIQGIVTFGVKRIALFGAYRVEKSYWQSPWLTESGLEEQIVLGLEQARDTMPPVVTMHRLFKPFVEDAVPGLAEGSRKFVAHPDGGPCCPASVAEPVSLAIGPEGGFTAYELDLLRRRGFEPVTLGPRVLRTEQAVPAFLGRLLGAAAGSAAST